MKQTAHPLPLSQIKQEFKIPIFKLKHMHHFNSNYHQAITVYGSMCLVIESYPNTNQTTFLNNLKMRNNLIKENCNCFPLIYQQHIVQKSKHIICLTLMENCVPLTKWLGVDNPQLKPTYFAKLIRSIDILHKFDYHLKSKIDAKQLLYLNNSEQISIDFTQIDLYQKHVQYQELFRSMVECAITLLSQKYNTNSKIQQIIFIKGQIYTFQPHKLRQARDCLQLLIFLNVCFNMEVQLISRTSKHELQLKRNSQSLSSSTEIPRYESPAKRKKVLIKTLQGNPFISIHNKQYEQLIFEDGKCTNCLKQVFYQQLSDKFIRDNSLYKLQQFEHLIVHISDNHSERTQQIITVYPPVSKVQLISFLIAYIKCINPNIISIVYYEPQNTLKLHFLNRKKQQKILNIIFYEEYIVKDQQISMILEKSQLSQCKLDLRKMKISDGFLVFLAHSQKSKDIAQLYLSDNYGLSDIGLSTFLISPYSDKLRTFSLTAINSQNPLLQQSIDIISNKRSLQKLYLKKYNLNSSTIRDQINVQNLNLTELESIGIKVTLKSVIKGNLKILRLDQLVHIQQLKNIQHLRLTQLKIKLVQQQKRSLMNSLSDFSLASSLKLSFGNKNSDESIKLFAEGASNKTLKILDISYSNCKYKTIRPLLLMGQLQKIVLDNCINLGIQFQSISSKILSVSLGNVQVDLQQTCAILQRSKQLIQLNIINTKLSKHEIIKLVSRNKMYVNNLIVSQLQYTNRLLEQSHGYQRIDCIQIYIDRLLEPEQQYSLNYIIMKVSQSKKTLRFIVSLNDNENDVQAKKQILIDRINKYLIMSCASVQSLSNIYINKTKVCELLQIQEDFQIQDSCESLVASSIAIGADRCRIKSQPKMIIDKYGTVPVHFKILEQQTIDKFIHRFAKYMQLHQLFIQVDLSNNKLIGKQIIDILLTYGRDSIKYLDFRNCMFKFDQIVDILFQFNCLHVINGGHYSISMNKQNFSARSQKYLKLFMRTKQIISLRIQCQEIQQIQILYSVLSHVIDQSSSTLRSLTLLFSQIKINREGQHFLKFVFNLQNLSSFQFFVKDCTIRQQQYSQIWQKGVNQLRILQKLTLSLPYFNFPMINLQNLIQVNLQFADGKAQENAVNKCIRNIPNSINLKIFRLSLANCPDINNVTRVLAAPPVGCIIENMEQLEHLSLNFQYCPLKQASLYELISYMNACKNLKMLELNVSFAIANIGDLVTSIEKMAEEFGKRISARIICVTQNSRNYVIKNDALSQKGIQFII